MGNCCAGSSNEGEVNMQTIGGAKVALNKAPRGANANAVIQRSLEDFLDDQPIQGFNGRIRTKLDGVRAVQALFRGALIRKKVKEQHGFVAKTVGSHNYQPGDYYYNQETNYDNARVQ